MVSEHGSNPSGMLSMANGSPERFMVQDLVQNQYGPPNLCCTCSSLSQDFMASTFSVEY